MKTQVVFKGFTPIIGFWEFDTLDGKSFFVKSFNDGILEIKCCIGQSVSDVAAIIVGCFDKDSNILFEVEKAAMQCPLNCPFDVTCKELKAIRLYCHNKRFEFNDKSNQEDIISSLAT